MAQKKWTLVIVSLEGNKESDNVINCYKVSRVYHAYLTIGILIHWIILNYM